jgi:hypothetical protein
MSLLFTQNLFVHCFALLLTSAPAKANAHVADHSVMIFIAEIALMLLVGRLLGEVMQRIGQPAVMGQLIAGVVLGPSVLGAIWPEASHAIFPTQSHKENDRRHLATRRSDAVVDNRNGNGFSARQAYAPNSLSSSIGGILLPFVCGFLIGEFLPDAMIQTRDNASPLRFPCDCPLHLVRQDCGDGRDGSRLHAPQRRANYSRVGDLDDTVGWIIIALIGPSSPKEASMWRA